MTKKRSNTNNQISITPISKEDNKSYPSLHMNSDTGKQMTL